MKNSALGSAPGGRILSIDRFRGLIIILMCAGDYWSGVASFPNWLKHSPGDGITVADTVAPMFLLAVGLTYRLSFQKHLSRSGMQAAYTRFATRYLALAGIGAVITVFNVLLRDPTSDWGVLQAIGVAGIITLCFIRTKAYVRIAAGLALLCIYQLAVLPALSERILSSDHGGLPGALSWAAMLLIFTAAGDFFKQSRFGYDILTIFCGGAGALLSVWIPLNKHLVSASYVLAGIFISMLFFRVFDLLSRRASDKEGVLVWWGRNPLTLYFLHLVYIGVFILPGLPFLYAQAPLWLAVLELAALYAALTLTARTLFGHNTVISI